MAYFYKRADQDKAADAEIRDRREAAALCLRIKPVIQSFDGKCYNVKLDRALREIGRFYCRKEKYFFEIGAYINNHCVTLCTIPITTALHDGKRINAKSIVDIIDGCREKFLCDAYEIEEAKGNIDFYINGFEELKKALEALSAKLPYTVRDIYNINYAMRRN